MSRTGREVVGGSFLYTCLVNEINCEKKSKMDFYVSLEKLHMGLVQHMVESLMAYSEQCFLTLVQLAALGSRSLRVTSSLSRLLSW